MLVSNTQFSCDASLPQVFAHTQNEYVKRVGGFLRNRSEMGGRVLRGENRLFIRLMRRHDLTNHNAVSKTNTFTYTYL